MNSIDINKYLRLLLDGKRDEANKIRLNSIPNKLVKFIWLDEEDDNSNQKKFDTLESNSIWLSDIKYVNDPYEFKGFYLDEIKLKNAGFSDELINCYRQIFDFKDIKISCLSSNNVDYLPMWVYYANNYRGFCVEYEVIKKNALYQVLYEGNRIGIANFILEIIKEGKLSMQSNDIKVRNHLRGLLDIFMSILYMKSDTWCHEREFRIIYHDDLERVGINKPINKLGLKISRVICGVNCSKKHFDKINTICNHLGLEKAYRSKLSKTKYGLEIY